MIKENFGIVTKRVTSLGDTSKTQQTTLETIMTRRKQVIPAATRKAVIARDNGRCRACGIGDIDNLHCDHIVPESKGGKATTDNLQAMCSVCNNRKGQTQTGELPILPPVDGFGDFNEVMQRRTEFLELLAEKRAEEILRITEMVEQWKAEGLRTLFVKKRLEKIMPARQVNKFL